MGKEGRKRQVAADQPAEGGKTRQHRAPQRPVQRRIRRARLPGGRRQAEKRKRVQKHAKCGCVTCQERLAGDEQADAAVRGVRLLREETVLAKTADLRLHAVAAGNAKGGHLALKAAQREPGSRFCHALRCMERQRSEMAEQAPLFQDQSVEQMTAFVKRQLRVDHLVAHRGKLRCAKKLVWRHDEPRRSAVEYNLIHACHAPIRRMRRITGPNGPNIFHGVAAAVDCQSQRAPKASI